MRSVPARTSTALVAVVAAVFGGLLGADPAQAAGDLNVSLQLPDLVDGIGSAMWTPNVDNSTGAVVSGTELTIVLTDPDSGETTLEAQSYTEGCAVGDAGDTVTCAGIDLREGITDFGLVLALRSGADAVAHPQVDFAASLRDADGALVATDEGSLVVRHDLQPRLELDAPAQVPADADSEAEGVKWTMTVHNNTDSATYDMDTVYVDASNADGPSRIRLAAGDSGCAVAESGGLACPLESLAPGADRQYELVLWAEADESLKDTATLRADIPQIDADNWAAAERELSVAARDATPAADTLPKTGLSLTVPIGLGAAALSAGGVLLVLSRRRQTSAS